ncbi:dehydrase and lipid transport-domain-containing protein [Ampelomyces quisqualis]|uniref:Dehydrase and lipid transport-domain-containing protein n=1 Tax=Ampelomyces quisqualis TaxID=50730 RepID=A0A6A5QXS5_AMPQU|nr:dehydrase and lipid transport-domain-containing protein [Ampelomyces quisqualis]
MATPKTARRLLNASLYLSQPTIQRRTFLPNPFAAATGASSTPQILTAHRVLGYPSAPIYSIIADVPSYATFLPYCQRSDITHWSAPDKIYGRRWPSEGKLTSGFGGITESFISRVYCVPGEYVESVGGDTETSLSRDDIAHHLEGSDTSSRGRRNGGDNGLLRHLRSKWTIKDLGRDKTGVSLALEFAFTNPFYAALSGGVAPKVADVMIKAFEQRVVALLKENPEMIKASLAELDGSRLKK